MRGLAILTGKIKNLCLIKSKESESGLEKLNPLQLLHIRYICCYTSITCCYWFVTLNINVL
jgi:hypothetical protein